MAADPINLLDRLILALAPAWGRRRLALRREIAELLKPPSPAPALGGRRRAPVWLAPARREHIEPPVVGHEAAVAARQRPRRP
jgi:hypothetical protein